jgi:phosphoribulokinase
MSRVSTLVVPGGKMGLAMELILTPFIRDLMERKTQANKQLDWMSDL